MPLDFIDRVASGIAHLDAGDWLTPETVDGLTDIDFITLVPAQRAELFRCAERFRSTAGAAPGVDAGQIAEARRALTTIWELLYPYRKPPESVTVRGVLWRASEDERVRDWIPTFDYQLSTDWSGDPCVRIWLILEDSVDIGAPETRQGLTRLRLLFRERLQEADIDRFPYAGVYTRSEVQSIAARALA